MPGQSGNHVVELLESGCGLIVGLVTSSGAPFATRGWGLTLFDGISRARILLGATDLAALGYSPGDVVGTVIAATGCNILSLKSVQLKGPITSVEVADDIDRERLDRYCNAFFDDVAIVDAIPRRLMERLVPSEIVACSFDVVEAYDQTPGPHAGSPLSIGAN